jgi:hypothetical protein
MSWWPWRTKREKLELEKAKQQIAQLERDYRTLALTLQNLQSAIIALSRSQDTVVGDVRSIQEMVHSFLHEVDPSQMMFGFSNGSNDEN